MMLMSRPVKRVLTGAIAAASAGLIAACGSAPSNVTSPPAAAAGGSGSPAAASPGSGPGSSPGTAPAGAQPCQTSALRASIPAPADAASGHYGVPVNLTNTSRSACTLNGYPGVSFVSGPGGSQIGTAATRATTAYIFRAQAPQLVTLAPGQTAHADLQLITTGVFEASQCGPQNVNLVRIYPPDQTSPLYAQMTAQTCTKGQDMLTVSPVQPVGTPNP